MTPVRYVGWREDLKGKTALARPAVHRGRKGEKRVMIQLDQLHLGWPCTACQGHGGFDDGVECGGCDGSGRAPNPLAFGWHDFAADQWEEIHVQEPA